MTDTETDSNLQVTTKSDESVPTIDFVQDKTVKEICLTEDPKNGLAKYHRIRDSKILYGVLKNKKLIYVWFALDRASLTGEYLSYISKFKDREGLELVIMDPCVNQFNENEKYNLLMLTMLMWCNKDEYGGPRFG